MRQPGRKLSESGQALGALRFCLRFLEVPVGLTEVARGGLIAQRLRPVAADKTVDNGTHQKEEDDAQRQLRPALGVKAVITQGPEKIREIRAGGQSGPQQR